MNVTNIILVIVFCIISQTNSDLLYTIFYLRSILMLSFLPNTIFRITLNVEVLTRKYVFPVYTMWQKR